jgi:hypothetical protein
MFTAKPRPVDHLKVTDTAFVLNLGFFALVGFNTIHHTDGHITWGSTWAMLDLGFVRTAGFIGGTGQ